MRLLLEIVVCSYRVVLHGLRQRRQTGVKVFDNDVPDYVMEALRHEYKSGLPESMIGKSVFRPWGASSSARSVAVG